MAVPAAFVIAIPVFTGGDLYQLPVRLKVREGTGLPVFMGSPET